MHVARRILAITAFALCTPIRAVAEWPAPVAPIVSEAAGYVAIPQAAHRPSASRTYRAVYDATRKADDPSRLIPALDMAGALLNALAAEQVPLSHAKLAVVFHGDALRAILDDESYRKRFGVPNPNLAVLSKLKAAGVELFVCGQNLAVEHIDPDSISSDVTIASGALFVLVDYGNDGYAALSF